MDKTEATENFWTAYRLATGWTGVDYDVIQFGDSAAMADELLALVLAGTKRATAGLLKDFTESGLPVPKPGDHVLVLNGAGIPACIYRSTDIRVGPLNSIDEIFAWDEGEGDRTRQWWLAAHHDFFARQSAAEGFEMHDGIDTVFERFAVVWPLNHADDQSSR